MGEIGGYTRMVRWLLGTGRRARWERNDGKLDLRLERTEDSGEYRRTNWADE